MEKVEGDRTGERERERERLRERGIKRHREVEGDTNAFTVIFRHSVSKPVNETDLQSVSHAHP